MRIPQFSLLILFCITGNQTPSYLHSSDSDSFSTSDIAGTYSSMTMISPHEHSYQYSLLSKGEPSAEKLVAYLYTLGEISQVTFTIGHFLRF